MFSAYHVDSVHHLQLDLHVGRLHCFCILHWSLAGIGCGAVDLDAVIPVHIEPDFLANVPQTNIVAASDVAGRHVDLLTVHIDALPASSV